MSRMTYIDAANQILTVAGHEMHQRDIYQEVSGKGLWVSRAQPQNVEPSTYGHLIKAAQAGHIGRVDNGPYFFAA